MEKLQVQGMQELTDREMAKIDAGWAWVIPAARVVVSVARSAWPYFTGGMSAGAAAAWGYNKYRGK